MKDKLLCTTIGLLIGVVVMQWAMPAGAQVTDFQGGVRVIPVTSQQITAFLYAKPNGDVYFRDRSSSWTGAPRYLGNFFGGQSVPGDFPAGLHAVTVDPANNIELIYASSTGDIYRQSGAPLGGIWNAPPVHFGNFFPGQSAPPDFQAGFHIVNETQANILSYVYVTPTGDAYDQNANGHWNQPPHYIGNYFGELPVPASQATFGKVKALYQPKGSNIKSTSSGKGDKQ